MEFFCGSDWIYYGDGGQGGFYLGVILLTLVTIIVCLANSRGRHKRNSEKLQAQYGEYLE
jgi:TM2 domain-containing membrane protein YozV